MLAASFDFKKERVGFFKRKCSEAALPQRLYRREKETERAVRDKAHFGAVMRQGFIQKDCPAQRCFGSSPL